MIQRINNIIFKREQDNWDLLDKKQCRYMNHQMEKASIKVQYDHWTFPQFEF
jgi:hypothetical protein